ncbi:site-specific integrase [Synechocystis sp. PCC 7509]|uniref:site-specific integrase n=1 Tax=Synechocystis sp. PCC 7509 TaxID=927677 RepID=UPI00048E2715|nr:site-specific integrase [Synechocystis sp. PCC 7509]
MKTAKGNVAIKNNCDRLRLRWSFRGERYCLALGLPYNKINLKAAQKIVSEIELDMLGGYFDPSLDKYRTNSVPTKTAKLALGEAKDLYLLPLWNEWVMSLKLSERTRNGHYKAILRHIEKANPQLDDVTWFERLEYAPRIFNDYLRYLNSCMRWAVDKGLLSRNPYTVVKRRKVVKKPIQPFNAEETAAIVTAFRANKFCPKSSAYLHSHYADYVEFLFLTGCRPSEAIGLQRRHINLERNEIVICSVLGRGDRGQTNGAARVRKETKTGSIRYLTMTTRLRKLLDERIDGLSADDLVFTSPLGNPIDDRAFIRRQWRVVLEGLGISYRQPYAIRHTLASVAIEKGVPPTGVAYLLGHSDMTMVMKTYGHMINRPSLPDVLG